MTILTVEILLAKCVYTEVAVDQLDKPTLNRPQMLRNQFVALHCMPT